MKCKAHTASAATLRRRVAERVDDGSGKKHHPWIETGDVSSLGFQTRMYCVKVGRTLHFHSSGEKAAALNALWREDVEGIDDQKAIPTAKSLLAAANLGVEHPIYSRLRVPSVFSTVLFLRVKDGSGYRYEAQAVRNLHMQIGRRADRLLSIEEEAWRLDGVPWKLVLADGMKAMRSKNLAWLQQCENDMNAWAPSAIEVEARAQLLTRLRRRVDSRVIDACRWLDKAHHYQVGTGARAFRQLLTLREVKANLDARSLVFEPIDEIEFTHPGDA
jgi:hypothetical protein